MNEKFGFLAFAAILAIAFAILATGVGQNRCPVKEAKPSVSTDACNGEGMETDATTATIVPTDGVRTVEVLEDLGRQDGRTGVRRSAASPFPVLKNGQRSVYFDYERGLEAVNAPRPLSPDVEKAETQGAEFKLSFLVVDENDAPIAGAEVAIVALGRKDSEVFSACTGDDGIATIEGNGTGEIHVEIDKNGYFHMSLWHWLFVPEFKCAAEGRWLPWNPTIKVQLPKKPLDRASIVYQSEFSLPDGEGSYGFDLVSGTGADSTNCDMVVTVKNDPRNSSGKHPWRRFEISFPGTGNGARIVKRNPFSECPFPPMAPETGYTNHLSLSGELPIADDETMIFKIRNSESEPPLYGVFPFIPSAIAHDFRFTAIINDKRGARTLYPGKQGRPLAKFFKLKPLETLPENPDAAGEPANLLR